MFGLIQQINPIRINHPENIRVGSRRSFDRPPLLMHVSRAKRRKWFSRASRRGNLSRYYIIPAMRRGTKRRVRRGTMDGGEITGSRASKDCIDKAKANKATTNLRNRVAESLCLRKLFVCLEWERIMRSVHERVSPRDD